MEFNVGVILVSMHNKINAISALIIASNAQVMVVKYVYQRFIERILLYALHVYNTVKYVVLNLIVGNVLMDFILMKILIVVKNSQHFQVEYINRVKIKVYVWEAANHV